MQKSIKITIAILFLSFSLAGIALAQATDINVISAGQTATDSVINAVNADENIQAKDLGISEPTILPNSPLYFLKNLSRSIQTLFTLNAVKKAELQQKFSNEKLMEAKKLIEIGAKPQIIEKAINNYQNQVSNVQKVTEQIKGAAATSTQALNFLDKFIQQQVLQQQILQKLETQVPTSTLEKIKEAREQHLEQFGQVMTKLEDKTKMQENLDKSMEQIKGSDFKDFKSLEVLKNLETRVTTTTKEAIQKTEDNLLNKLQSNLEKLSPEDQTKFKDYLDKINGNKEQQMEILQNLKAKVQNATATLKTIQLKEKLEQGQTKILQKIENGLKKANCPSWTPPAADFCKQGRIYIPKNPTTGCPMEPKCIAPSETSTSKPITPGTSEPMNATPKQ